MWSCALRVRAGDLEAARLKQKVYLARYGRIDPFSWENRDVTELRDYFEAMSLLVREENELSRTRENHG